MKIPALKAKIGTWDYYVTTLTFKQVAENVIRISNQLYTSEALKDLLQRSITDNYLSIQEYILKQPEMFFNSLVLAVYDDYPNWREIEFSYKNVETFQMGLLEFPIKAKIFAVDGQHRVEGIKEALLTNPGLENERIAALFIGHKNNDEGKKQTRRLFTTLNRYAKPVTTDDIIALDEDDSAAIVTRSQVEEYKLFSGKRIVRAKQKTIPPTNKDAITSIITLYQANVELYKDFYFTKNQKILKKSQLVDELKFRPKSDVLLDFQNFCISFWDAFCTLEIVSNYLEEQKDYATKFRNNVNGGNLIFRPIGFLPLIKAAIFIKQNSKLSYNHIFKKFKSTTFILNAKPWNNVLWEPVTKTMIMNSDSITESLLVFLFDPKYLSEKKLQSLKNGYASKLSIEDPIKIEKILDTLK